MFLVFRFHFFVCSIDSRVCENDLVFAEDAVRDFVERPSYQMAAAASDVSDDVTKVEVSIVTSVIPFSRHLCVPWHPWPACTGVVSRNQPLSFLHTMHALRLQVYTIVLLHDGLLEKHY